MATTKNKAAGYAGSEPMAQPTPTSVDAATSAAGTKNSNPAAWNSLSGGNPNTLKIAVVIWAVLGIWAIMNVGKK